MRHVTRCTRHCQTRLEHDCNTWHNSHTSQGVEKSLHRGRNRLRLPGANFRTCAKHAPHGRGVKFDHHGATLSWSQDTCGHGAEGIIYQMKCATISPLSSACRCSAWCMHVFPLLVCVFGWCWLGVHCRFLGSYICVAACCSMLACMCAWCGALPHEHASVNMMSEAKAPNAPSIPLDTFFDTCSLCCSTYFITLRHILQHERDTLSETTEAL